MTNYFQSQKLQKRLLSQTKMVMGKQSDIHPAAVVHVTGTLKKDRNVDASQIVILTGYVEIK